MERKRRLEKIMSRVKRPDESSSPSNEDNPVVSEATIDTVVSTIDERSEQNADASLEEHVLEPSDCSGTGGVTKEDSPLPAEAWMGEDTLVDEEDEEKELCRDAGEDGDNVVMGGKEVCRSDSPAQLSDTALNLSGPESHSSSHASQPSPQQQQQPHEPHQTDSNALATGDNGTEQGPQFKSRLLQSWVGTGRLNSPRTPADDSDERQQRAALPASSNLSSGGSDQGMADTDRSASPHTADSHGSDICLQQPSSKGALLTDMSVANGIISVSNRNQAM